MIAKLGISLSMRLELPPTQKQTGLQAGPATREILGGGNGYVHPHRTITEDISEKEKANRNREREIVRGGLRGALNNAHVLRCNTVK